MSDTRGKSSPKKNRNRRNPSKNKPEEVKTSNETDTEQNSQDQLDRELTWCIQQLTIGLSKPNKKLSHKQGSQAVEALRLLSNPKTHLVKKRQLMRVNFGDYRKKMAEEEKQHVANMAKPTVNKGTAPEKSTFPFLKKASQHAPKKDTPSNISPSGTSGFAFNFKVDSEESGIEGKIVSETKSEAASKMENTKLEELKPTVNYFKMQPNEGNTDFIFNFTVE